MKSQTEQTYRERMLRVLVHIQRHLDEALCLETLAELACFSPFHFHRIFQGMVGESVMAHVRRLRLERAALRLKHTDQPVTRIAFEAGYETHEAFTRAFHAMFGESPTRFRELHQPVPVPATPSGVHYSPGGGPEEFTIAGGGSIMEASIRKCDELRVVFVRHVGPYNEVGPTWEKLCKAAGKKGLFGWGKPTLLGLCHDDPAVTPPDKIRYDACLVIKKDAQPEGELGVQTIAGGEYAVAVHHGPYEQLGETYAALCGQWIPAQGREIAAAPSFEVYKNNPQTTKPEKLLTEVYVPLEPRA
jgi:AraC family transcriptional regulator